MHSIYIYIYIHSVINVISYIPKYCMYMYIYVLQMLLYSSITFAPGTRLHPSERIQPNVKITERYCEDF